MNNEWIDYLENGVRLEEEEEVEEEEEERVNHNSWMQKVTTGMRDMRIKTIEWIAREEWRKKNKI